jgi:hypothetical protein
MGVKFIICLLVSLPLFSQYDSVSFQQDDTSIVLDSSQFIIHQVSYVDNFFSLKRKYNITKQKLLKINPQLKTGLTVGSLILIPNLNEPYSRFVFQNKNNRFKIDLLLPFCLFENKNILNIDIDSISLLDSDTIHFYSKTRISIDFLSGFLMSLDSVHLDTSLIHIRIHDIGHFDNELKYNFVLDSLIDNNLLLDSDLIIGPLYTDNFNFLTDNFQNKKIPIISPFSHKKSIINGHENAIQSSISIDDKIVFLSQYIKIHHANDYKIIISRDTIFESKEGPNATLLIDTFITQDIEYSKHFLNNLDSAYSKSIELIKVQSHVIDSIYHKLDTLGNKNVIVILSQDNIFVSDLISKIHAARNPNLCIYTLPSILKFDHIPVSELMDLFVAFPDNKSFFNEKKLRSFLIDFHNKFSYFPVLNYASEGYKLGYNFINMLHDNREILPLSQSQYVKILDGYYSFIKDDLGGGYKNNAISILRYNEFLNFD